MVQCAQNGGYGPRDHPAVPSSPEQIAADAAACRRAGAGSVHFHPHGPDGVQTLGADAHGAAVAAVRAACPGLELSCSTAEGIDLGGAADRVAAVQAWHVLPDVVSLNVDEDGMLELGQALLARGIGIEAGVFTLEGAELLLEAPWRSRIHRVLVEVIHEPEPDVAVALARAIDDRVAELGRPRLWHGDGEATWAVVDAGLARGRDVRVGLEDSLVGRDGGRAPDNAEQVADTVARAAG